MGGPRNDMGAYGSPDGKYFVLPIADFSASQTQGEIPFCVTFQDNSLEEISNYLWNFGDGEIGIEQSPTHIYLNVGYYSVSLTVSGPGGTTRKIQQDYIHAIESKPSIIVYQDMDGDCYGNPNVAFLVFDISEGYVDNKDDCNDNDPYINLNAEETCDGKDNDCDGIVDNADFMHYTGTSVGECQQGIINCIAGQIKIIQQEIGPDTEICDGKDNDCDGITDNGNFIQYTGIDEGECQQEIINCIDGQLQQTQQEIKPATELCDGLDNNCNGKVDEGLLNTYYLDSDQDGCGDINQTIEDCSLPSGYVENANDSDDQVIKPIPDFSCSVSLGYIPLAIQFTDKSIGNVNYSWDFGDGGTSNEEDPNHTFTEAGAYNVTLTVDIEGNCLTQKSKTINALGTASLTGRVLSQDGPIVGAEVRVLGHAEYNAITGDGGVFTISDLRLGNHTLRVTAFEYETKFEKIVNRPGEEIDISLNGKVGWICGKILQAEDNEPIPATVIAFTHEDRFYSRTAQSDPNDGNYIIYLSRFGNYSLLAFSKDYYPYVDSNHGGQYTIGGVKGKR